MSWRRVLRVSILLLPVALGAIVAWRVSARWPETLRRIEGEVRAAAAARGLSVSWKSLRFHLLYVRITLEGVDVSDAAARLPLLRSARVDLSLSPSKFLAGELPVSRVRVRDGEFTFQEGNLPLLRRLRAEAGGGGEGDLPEILVVESRLRVGPFPRIPSAAARVKEFRIRRTRFLGTRVDADADGVEARLLLPSGGEASVPPLAVKAELSLSEGQARVRRLAVAGAGASVRLSGRVDPSGKGNDLKGSGEVDLARWISAGAPFASVASAFATQGKVAFSCSLKGPLSDPEGEGRAVLSGGRLVVFSPAGAAGGVAASGELAASYGKGTVRIASAKGLLWGGTVEGEGSYDLRGATGKGRIAGTALSAADLPLPADLPVRPLGKGSFSLAAEGTLERLAFRLAADASGGVELRAGAASPARLPGPVSLEAAGTADLGRRTAVLERSRLSSPLLSASASGSVDLPGGIVALSAEGRSPAGSLRELSLPGRLSWGGVAAHVTAEGSLADLLVRGSLAAESVAPASLPPSSLSARVEGSTGTAIHFVADVPSGPVPMTATGTVSLPDAAARRPALVDATLAVRPTELSHLSRSLPALLQEAGAGTVSLPPLSGTVEGEVDLRLTGPERTVGWAVRSPRLRVGAVEAEGASAEGKWWRRGSAPAGWEGRAAGSVAGGTVTVAGASRDGRLSASADVSGADGGRLAALAGWPRGRELLSGAWDGHAEVVATPTGWDVPSFRAACPTLTVGGARLSGILLEGAVTRGAGRATLRAVDPGVAAEASFRAEGEWPARVEATLSALPTSVAASLARGKQVRAEGLWAGEGSARLLLGRLTSPGNDPWSAVPVLRLRLAGEGVAAEGLSFGRLELSAERSGDTLRASLDSRDPAGRLDGTVTLRAPYPFRLSGPFAAAKEVVRGDGPSWSLAGRVDASGALLEARRTEGTLQLERFRLRARDFDLAGKDVPIHVDASGARLAGGTILAEGNPLALSGRVTWKGEVDAKAEGRMPVGVVRILVPGVFDRLDGMASFDLRLTGKARAPDLVGTARLEGGILSFQGYNQYFEEMKAEATLTKERIVFERFSGRSGGGWLDGRGEIPLTDSPSERMRFSVDFVDMRYPYPEEFRPVLDGHAELFGTYNEFVVTGDVSVRSALYSRPARFEKGLLDLRRRLEEVSARREKGSFNVHLDLNCVADGTLRIRNNLVDAVAKGEFKVAGDIYRPVVLGVFDLLEGTLVFQGDRYTVKRLSVEFNDPRRNNPRIDGAAEVKKENVLITVLVTGTLEKYEVDFVSDPPLGKNDILSLLTLGVRTSSLEGQEGTVGASAASTLALTPYKGRVEDEIRGIAGLDRFAVEAAYSSSSRTFEPRFVVGKSFGDRLNVSVSTLVGTSSETSAMAELKLLEHVFLQGAWESATTTREGELGADIKVRYRYRSFRDVFGRSE